MTLTKVELKEIIKELIQENLTVDVSYNGNRVGVEIRYDGEHVDYDSDSYYM